MYKPEQCLDIAQKVYLVKKKYITYICKHFVTTGDKYKFMDDIFLDYDFLLLQEHWLYKSAFPKLLSLGSSTDMTAVRAMDESIHRVGALFIWWVRYCMESFYYWSNN